MARAWLNEAVPLLRAARVRFDGQVRVRMYLSPPDRRTRDGDNLEKAIMDALVRARVIKDDSLKYVRKSCKEVLDEYMGYVLLVVEPV
jgi:Holliday junction resolvase RusA-like endonuclease